MQINKSKGSTQSTVAGRRQRDERSAQSPTESRARSASTEQLPGPATEPRAADRKRGSPPDAPEAVSGTRGEDHTTKNESRVEKFGGFPLSMGNSPLYDTVRGEPAQLLTRTL